MGWHLLCIPQLARLHTSGCCLDSHHEVFCFSQSPTLSPFCTVYFQHMDENIFAPCKVCFDPFVLIFLSMNKAAVCFPMAFIKFPGKKVGVAKTRKWFKSVCHIWEMMFTVLLCGVLHISYFIPHFRVSRPRTGRTAQQPFRYYKGWQPSPNWKQTIFSLLFYMLYIFLKSAVINLSFDLLSLSSVFLDNVPFFTF